MKKTQRKIISVSYLYMWYGFMLIYINFNFDFLGLGQRLFLKLLRQWTHKMSRFRVVSDIQTLAFGSSLYIRYNTAAHVVNSTYIYIYMQLSD
jgi:hypothetical protein